MKVQQAYNEWAAQYDSNENKTRDLEARALRETLAGIAIDSCLEVGCGTGKNTEWLAQRACEVLSVDFSEEMLARAKAKVTSKHVTFLNADISDSWTFVTKPYSLITFSLVLEHIEDLGPVFEKASKALASGGHVYVGELHPFKQYGGTKARFETEEGLNVVNCFNHHISDFTRAAMKHGLLPDDVNEYFDNDDRTMVPRILTLLFRKP